MQSWRLLTCDQPVIRQIDGYGDEMGDLAHAFPSDFFYPGVGWPG
jgi:hypothetical protein